MINEDTTTVESNRVKFEPLHPPLQDSYDNLTTWSAYVNRDNFIPNTFKKLGDYALTAYELFTQDNEDYEPLSEKERDKYEPKYWPLVGDAATPQSAARKVLRAKEEEYYTHIMEHGSPWGLIGAGFQNNFTSPLLTMPVAQGIKQATFLKSAWKGTVAAIPGIFAANVAEEAFLQFTQETRKIRESAANIVVGSIVGSVLTGGTSAVINIFGPKLFSKLVRETVEGAEVKTVLSPEGNVSGVSVVDAGGYGSGKYENIDIESLRPLGTEKDSWNYIAKGAFWLTDKLARNPTVRGLRSPFKSMVALTNDMFEHNYDITGSYKGEFVQPKKLQSAIIDWEKRGSVYQLDLIDAYYKQIGVDTDSKLLNAGLASTPFRDPSQNMSFKEFSLRAAIAVTKGGIDEKYPNIQAIAKKTIDTQLQPVADELVKLNKLPANITPFGAAQHLQRNYDIPYMVATRPDRVADLTELYEGFNIEVINLIEPRELLIKQLKEIRINGTSKEIRIAENKLKKENKNIKTKILKGQIKPELLVGDAGMDWPTLQKSKSLRKEINKLKLAKTHAEEDLKVYKRELNAGRKAFTPNVAADSKQLALEAKVNSATEHLKVKRKELEGQVLAGNLDPTLFFKTPKGNLRLKKPNYGTLQFRRILNNSELKIAAESTIDNITKMSPDQMAEQIQGMLRRGSGDSNLTNPRVLLAQDEWLYERGFLRSDLRQTIPMYLKRMGRLIETEKFLRARGYSGEGDKLLFLGESIHAEARVLQNAIDTKLANKIAKNPAKAEKYKKAAERERIKLDKKRQSAVNLSEIFFRRITGAPPQGNKDLIRFSRALNNWAFASQLGLMTATMTGDTVSQIFRQGAVPYLKNGPIRFFRNFVTHNGGNRRLRNSARDIGYGIDLESAINTIKFDSSLDIDLPSNKLEHGLAQAATGMGILNWSAIWNDAFTRVAATSVQSNIYRQALKFQAGKLKGSDLAQFKVLGLNDPKLIARFIDQFDTQKFGQKIQGAFEPNLHLWTDGEAALRYRLAIRQQVRSTIFAGKDMGSYPAEIDFNGAGNSLLMYMGWPLHAIQNYLLPFLQRFDGNKVVGAAAIWFMASFTDPIRKIARGQELTDEDLDPMNMANKGFLNSGLTGAYAQVFNQANAAFELIPELIINKHADKGKLELMSSAPGSFFNFLGIGLKQALKWQRNKKDMKTMARNFPLVMNIMTQKIVNEWIDEMDIPDTAEEGDRQKRREQGIPEPRKERKPKKRK